MSTATSRPEYADVLARALPSVIHSEKENDRCLALPAGLLSHIGPLQPLDINLAHLQHSLPHPFRFLGIFVS